MSEVRASTAIMTEPGEFLTPDPVSRVRRVGYWILGLQFVGFLVWSAILYDHFALTSDFAIYNQPWFLIAHGNLDPYLSTVSFPFWQNDAEFIFWPLAPLYWVSRNSQVLQWLQDASVAGAEVVAFTWLCEVAARHRPGRDARLLACLGLLLLVANPWIWSTVSFDVHEEPLTMLVTALLVWDLAHGRRRAWLWAVIVLMGGAPSASFVVGIGLCGVLASRSTRKQGVLLAILGVAWSLFIVAIHGDVGVPLARHYGYLTTTNGAVPANLNLGGLLRGVVTHPQVTLDVLHEKLPNIFANLAPGGLIGLAAPVLMPLLLFALLSGTLSQGYVFSEPLFQSVVVYVLLPVGTVIVLAWIARRHRRIALVLGGVIAAQALGWAVVWGPRIPGEWLRVPHSTAETLADLEARIPESASVVASQGVVGRFSSREHVIRLFGGLPIRLHGRTWFVLTPQEGIETVSAATTEALIGELAGPMHATLLTHANGVWAFVLDPPPGVHTLDVPRDLAPLPAWTCQGAAGHAVLTGPETSWHVTSTGAQGYVVDQLEWQEAPPRRYTAAVTLSTTGPVNVEVWNDTGNVLVARRLVLRTSGIQTITLPVNATAPYQGTVYSGWGPFRADFKPPPAGERLEVRVWSPGNTLINVYNADLAAAPAQ